MYLINLLKKELLSRELLIKRVNIKELNSIKYVSHEVDVIRELGMLDSGSLVVNLEPKRLRTFEACAFTPLDNYCPWVDTAKLIINDKLDRYENSPLNDFYKNWAPQTAFEYFRFSDKPKNRILFQKISVRLN